jgi:hypothetical protein
MPIKRVHEDSWSGENSAWHNAGAADQWYNGTDQWHGSTTCEEDWAVANLVTTETVSWPHIHKARALMQQTLRDPVNNKHKYFEFMRCIAHTHGDNYCSSMHEQAAKICRKHKDKLVPWRKNIS